MSDSPISKRAKNASKSVREGLYRVFEGLKIMFSATIDSAADLRSEMIFPLFRLMTDYLDQSSRYIPYNQLGVGSDLKLASLDRQSKFLVFNSTLDAIFCSVPNSLIFHNFMIIFSITYARGLTMNLLVLRRVLCF